METEWSGAISGNGFDNFKALHQSLKVSGMCIHDVTYCIHNVTEAYLTLHDILTVLNHGA